MTQLEERLSGALHARAHQIDEADLRPAELPEAGAHRSRFLLVLAAAACTALVIGVPYAIAQLDSSHAPERPPATSPPSATATTTGVGEGADWPISGVGRIDLDGDGNDETMRLRLDPTIGLNPTGSRGARVEVDLWSGTVYTVLSGRSELHLEGAADLPGSDGQELLLSVGTSLKVFDLVDGQLRELEAPDDPPLIRRTDNQGRTVTWTADGSGLSTVRSLEPVRSGDDVFPAQRWRWRVSGTALVATDSNTGCSPVSDPGKLVNCVNDPIQDVQAESLTSVPISTTIRPDFEINGQPVTARLVPRDGFAGDWMSDGDVRLVVSAGENTWETDLGPGPIPRLYEQRVLPNMTNAVGFLVGRKAFDGEAWLVFTIVDGKLIELTTPKQDPMLGSTVDSVLHNQGHETRSWVQGDFLYSSYGANSAKQVYWWEQAGTSLVPHLIGTYCFRSDYDGQPC